MRPNHREIWIRSKERQQDANDAVRRRRHDGRTVRGSAPAGPPDSGARPGQVRIRVAAAPVEASDLHTVRGRYGFTPEFPTVPGIESVGVIDELGSGTDGLTVGQRVITVGVRGTWQEYVVADAEQVLPVPVAMSDSTAAQILSNPLTAVILTGDELDVRPGEWLLQTAAGSIVGQSVIQLGAHVGFKTLNVVRRRSAVEDILALGGTAVICTEDEDLRERVADIAGDGRRLQGDRLCQRPGGCGRVARAGTAR